MTARLLAAFTLAPNAPAKSNVAKIPPYEVVHAAATRERAANESPRAMTVCSFQRSARRPHGSSVKSMPMPTAPSTTPVSPSESR